MPYSQIFYDKHARAWAFRNLETGLVRHYKSKELAARLRGMLISYDEGKPTFVRRFPKRAVV